MWCQVHQSCDVTQYITTTCHSDCFKLVILIGHQQETQQCIQKFLEMGNICLPVNFFGPGSDELFVGRAGYLCGSLLLNRKLGRNVVPSSVTRSLFDAIIESGRQYSQKHRSKSPLMYSYYRTEYLGKYITVLYWSFKFTCSSKSIYQK